MVVMALAGCNRNPLVGKWSGEKNLRGASVKATLTLAKDGKFTLAQDIQGGALKIAQVQSGSYEVEAGKEAKMTFHVTRLLINGKPLAAQTNAIVTQPYTVEKDTLTINPGGGDMKELVLTRTK